MRRILVALATIAVVTILAVSTAAFVNIHSASAASKGPAAIYHPVHASQ